MQKSVHSPACFILSISECISIKFDVWEMQESNQNVVGRTRYWTTVGGSNETGESCWMLSLIIYLTKHFYDLWR